MATAHAPKQPGFLHSVTSGIAGYVKGLFAGGAIGAIAGAVIGLSIAVATGGTGAVLTGLVLQGTGIGAALFAGVGALAGMVTGVVKSRETGANSAQNVASVANIAFTQGVAVGQQVAVAESAGMSFREREDQRRATQALQQHQLH